MTNLRVAVVARAVMPLHGVGGLERSVHDLVQYLAQRGAHVTLIVPPPSRAAADTMPAFDPAHVHVRHVPYVTFPFANRRGTTVIDRSTAYLLYGWRAGRLAASLARANAVDIVHGFGASVLGATGRRSGVPLVLNPQGLEEFGATAMSQPLAKRLGYGPLRAAVRRCARAADRIIATDIALEPTVVRHLSPRPGQMVTIPNGLDLGVVASAGPTEGAALRQRYGLDPDEFVLLSVGRLEFNKGFDVLARALGRAVEQAPLRERPWRWVIVGSGPFRPEIASAADNAGILDHVTFTGRVSDAELHAWYEAASVFAHPTRYEGSSLVTLEAMAHRRGVIATRAGGLPDKVKPGVNGWLVEPDDVEGLADAVRAAASDPARLSAMGVESRALVEHTFSWSVLVDRHIAMYEALVQSSKSARRI